MRLYIIGPGAMGQLFAAYLSRGGQEVALLDYRPDRAALLNRSGLRIHGVRGEIRVEVPVHLPGESLAPPDLLLLWVKSYSTAAALEMFRPLLGTDTLVLTAQNGLGNAEAIASLAPAANVLAGTTTLGAHVTGPGEVHHAAEGDTLIGELTGGLSQRVVDLCRLFSEAGIPSRPTTDIRRAMWEKLAVNAAINPLTALLGVPNGALLERPPVRRLMAGVVREVVAAAHRQGVGLEARACWERVKRVAEATAQNRSSMLQDIEAGRRTEIEAINGQVAAIGGAPLNQALVTIIRSLTAGKEEDHES